MGVGGQMQQQVGHVLLPSNHLSKSSTGVAVIADGKQKQSQVLVKPALCYVVARRLVYSTATRIRPPADVVRSTNL
jgi:hypothetical protein